MPEHYLDPMPLWFEISPHSARLCYRCRGKAEFVNDNKKYVCSKCLKKRFFWQNIIDKIQEIVHEKTKA